ncbi:MAG: lipocalin-like domain-containing protein [Bacteroidales bacterium]|jgi:hypothetical protein|nr:lipocalin-like domain-containing protein [Bacteroidales bacterium]
MKRKLLYSAALSLILGGFLFNGCKEEEDHDLITGKWRDKAVVEDTLISDCTKQSYLEFSDYVFQATQRRVKDVKISGQFDTIINGDTVTMCRQPYTSNYTYTIAHDTLTMMNIATQAEKQYIINKIDQNEMILKSTTLEVYTTYLRWE